MRVLHVEKIKAKYASAYQVPLYWIYDGDDLICMCETMDKVRLILKCLESDKVKG